MRIQTNGSNGTPKAAIRRRRGTQTQQRSTFLNQKLILVLAAVAVIIFALGLMLGTLIFGSPPESHASATSSVNNAATSPLVAATSKIAVSDMQRLIAESAAAEEYEEEEHRQEEEALKHGDKKLALHLRGALVPGDPNYNPHHHIDDALEDVDDPLNSNQEIVGGEDVDDPYNSNQEIVGGEEEEEENIIENLHHHVNKLKGAAAGAAKKRTSKKVAQKDDTKENLIENMHHQFAQALEREKHAIDSAVKEGVNKFKALRGAVKKDETTESLPQHYPYMRNPVPKDYDFTKYEPLGGYRFIEYLEGDSPYEITDSLREQSDNLARSRRVHVLNAMKHVWKNYKEYAFGMDELHPISHKGNTNWGGMGTTLGKCSI